LLRPVSLEGGRIRHLPDALVEGIDDRRGEGERDIPYSEADQPRAGGLLREGGDTPPDLGEQVARLELQVVRVDAGHERQSNGYRLRFPALELTAALQRSRTRQTRGGSSSTPDFMASPADFRNGNP